MPALLVQGIAIGFSAGISPGPLIAIFLNHASKFGWRRTLPAVFAPLISDGPIIVVSLLLLSQLPPWFLTVLRLAGGVFLIYLAARMFLSRDQAEAPPESARDRTHPLWTAVAVNLVNPNPYIFWGFVIGPILVSAWRSSPAVSLLFVAGFYLTMLAVFAAWILLFGQAAQLPPHIRRGVSVLSSLGMAGFGMYQILLGLGMIGTG